MALVNTNGTEMSYLTHKRVYGPGHYDRLVDQAIEEMGELTTKLMQRRRGRDVKTDAIVEEIVDVTLCLDFLLRDFCVSADMIRGEASQLAVQLDAKLSIADRRGDLMIEYG